MNHENLDQLLAQRREAPLPRLPSSFQQDVWRAIRQRKAAQAESWHAWAGRLLEPLLHPAMLVCALSIALVLGVGVGTVASDRRATQTRYALNLEVFGSASPGLPATLMGHTK